MLTKVHGVGKSRLLIQIVRSAGSLLILLFLIWSAGRAGFASLLYTYAARTNQLTAANAAVILSPRDPQAHLIRGGTLEASDDLSAATMEYSEAVSLRPVDYVVWLNLAHGRELIGDKAGARDAASEAVRLAPYYAQPHWQLGNLLVRAGRQDQGFAELRLAAASDPSLLPSMVDLAWQLSQGNPQYVLQSIQPNTPEAYIAVADYFRKRGKATEAVALIRAAGNAAEDYRRRYLDELISAKRFEDAYSLWLITHPADPAAAVTVDNPGFEHESDLDGPGFGWRAKKLPGVLLSLDSANPREGKSSLRIEFKGESDPGFPIITHLVILQPRAHYQLHFAVRTEEIVSGGLPGMIILDAGSGQALSQPGAFPLASNGWRDYTVDFTVPETSPTIQIALQRERCQTSPCPIYGRLWLDNFVLQKQ